MHLSDRNKPIQQNGTSRIESDFTVSFHTLGCKVNRYETDAIRQAFAKQGFRVAADDEDADVFVINTCTVTAEADRKSRQMIRRARRRNKEALVVAMGCHIEMQKGASEADISVGTHNRLSIMDQVLDRLNIYRMGSVAPATDPPVDPADVHKESYDNCRAYPEFGSVISQEDTRAYIKIEDGCDSFCSYCIIPYARGRVVSRLEEDVFREAAALGSLGFREIVLTGIHICAYGTDRGEEPEALLQLLLRIDGIPDIHRIRLGSLEPNSVTESFCAGLAKVSKLCPHFHISLQSGSDSVLSRMNRTYDREKYRACISLIRSYFPRISITTDVIVAFPGETQKEHDESLRFCQEIGFARIHVFPFSPRSGTKAAQMSPFVHPDISAERTKEFLALSSSLLEKFAMTFAGEKVEVLLEKQEPTGYLSGYCKEYLRVYVKTDTRIGPGSEVKAIILSTNSNALYGTITD